MANYLKTYLLLALLSIKCIHSKSIDMEEMAEDDSENSYIPLSPLFCIGAVVAVVVAGGLCTFSKKRKISTTTENMTSVNSSSSERQLHANLVHHPDSNANSLTNSSTSTEESGKSELKHLQGNKRQSETRFSDHVMDIPNSYEPEENPRDSNDEEGNKRRSFLGISISSKHSSTKLKNKKRGSSKSGSYQIQILDDRSINSISTNEDWINEQKYQAHLKHECHYGEEGHDYNENEEEEDIENCSVVSEETNDGFWSSELEPIRSSSTKKEESYAVPSLGRRSTMIIKAGEQQNSSNKRQSVIIVDDVDLVDKLDSLSQDENEMIVKPTRVKSWKNKDLNKEILEILNGMDAEDKRIEEEEEKKQHQKDIKQKEEIIQHEPIRVDEELQEEGRNMN